MAKGRHKHPNPPTVRRMRTDGGIVLHSTISMERKNSSRGEEEGGVGRKDKDKSVV